MQLGDRKLIRPMALPDLDGTARGGSTRFAVLLVFSSINSGFAGHYGKLQLMCRLKPIFTVTIVSPVSSNGWRRRQHLYNVASAMISFVSAPIDHHGE